MYFSTKPFGVRFFYNLLTKLAWLHLKVIALFNQKIKLFVKGRQASFSQLKQINPEKPVIWMHVASLGEYEQGLPLLERLKLEYPNHQFLITFFSPSGYEVKKDKTPADYVSYLPMDTLSNVKMFMGYVKPALAIFIKYEIWPNYLNELKKQEIPTILVSAIFSKRQIYFRPLGGFMRRALQNFNHIFVQDKNSKDLLHTINFQNVTVSGDTRFDRVGKILQNENQLDFMGNFKGDKQCFVAGSTWPEDEDVLIDYINAATTTKFVIAPHNIKEKHITSLLNQINQKTIRYSKHDPQELDHAQVMILDTIGLLTKVYSYADIAYVGGGFATGLHNTLEPAVFGIPVLIGPNYKGFKEAEDLVKLGGIISIENKKELQNQMNRLTTDKDYFDETSQKNSTYIKQNQGATEHITNKIKDLN